MTQPFASIHPNAKIADSVIIEPFCVIEKNVTIGAGTYIGPNVTIYENTTIGENCRIFPGAVVGAIPQDLKFKGEETFTVIGNNTTLRECVTVHRGTASKGKTVIGDNCLVMAYCHVAHDCRLGNNIIMSNCTQLAGEVVVDDYAVIGGGTLVHQFSHIGKHVMVQGGSKVNKDIPPYVMAAREPISYVGINSIGLRRRGFTSEQVQNIQDMYCTIFQSNLNVTLAIETIESTMPATPERDEIILFVRSSPRGILKGYGR